PPFRCQTHQTDMRSRIVHASKPHTAPHERSSAMPAQQRPRTRSAALYEEALKHIVGGVNSPSRSFQAVGGGAPVFMTRAKGAYFWDVDGNRYIDYLAAYGPIITGHAHPHIVEAIA